MTTEDPTENFHDFQAIAKNFHDFHARSRKPRRAAGAIAVHEYRNCSATASLRRACGCEVRAAGPRGATAA